jgi:lipoprotein signal peptidase
VTLAFLKPSLIKLIFLAEWLLLVLFGLAGGALTPARAVAGSILPVAFFYLVACILFAISGKRQQLARRRSRLHIIALSLVVADQVLKTAVQQAIPYQDSIPIIPGLLHLAHERNLRGSWLLEVLDVSFVNHAMLVLLILPFLIGVLLGHGYYASRHRKSVWADVVYLGLFSGLLSALCDLVLRGFTLDYIQVPEIVTADLKDLFITLALAAYFAEMVDNPNISLRWRGWRQERQAHRVLAADFWSYTRQEIYGLWAALLKWGREKSRP